MIGTLCYGISRRRREGKDQNTDEIPFCQAGDGGPYTHHFFDEHHDKSSSLRRTYVLLEGTAL